jgi:hypothetical protein
VIVKQSPRDSAVHRSIVGEDHAWGLNEQLLAALFDVLAVANWQRGGDGGAKKPEPLMRPGVKKNRGDVVAQGKAVPMDEMNALLGWDMPG